MAENYIKYKRFFIFTSLVVTVLASLSMYGWINHVDILTSLLPGHSPMKFNTAMCVLLLCVSFLLQTCRLFIFIILSRLLSLFTLAVGLLSFLHHLIDIGFNISEFFFRHSDFGDPDHDHHFVLSAQTAVCIILTSLGILLARAYKMRYRIASQFLLHIVTFISFIVLLGYLYEVPHFRHFSIMTSMALPTALSFLLLSIAVSFMNPCVGITGVFTGTLIGNLMARRFFVPMLICIIAIGYLRLLSDRHQILPDDLGIALAAVVFALNTLILIIFISVILNRSYAKLRNAEENFRAVVESAPNALVISDMKGKIALVNKQAQRIFGYNHTEMVGQDLEILVPERFRGAHSSKQPRYFRNPHPRHFEAGLDLYALHKGGTEFPVEISITPILTKEGTVALASIIDVTERKHNEKVIRDQLIELQFKNEELEHFNYISSHDLQEPLRTVLNYIMLLREDYPGLDDEVKMHLGEIESSVTRMSQVVRSLLEFGKLGRNKQLSPIHVGDVVDAVVTDLNTLIKANNAQVVVETQLPSIYAYETELRQLFQNLVSNAIKFKQNGISPLVKIGCSELKGFYEFYVSDNGIGIAPEDYEKIFHIFQRLNNQDSRGGHGIGLANCKKIAEMHGGKIWLESEKGVGSTFKFTVLNLNHE